MAPRRTIVAAMVIASCAMLASTCSDQAQTQTPPAIVNAPPPMPQPMKVNPASLQRRTLAADLPLLPEGVEFGARPVEVVRAVYEFAARHPEVLKFVPCFCGCERPGMNHRGNDDCFVSGRDSAGRVTGWEAHGMVCEICLDVGQKAMQMHNSGASTSAIRDAIEKLYAGQVDHHTPTPMPPRGGHGSHDPN